MKKELGIFLASGIGLVAALGIWGLRKYLSTRHKKYAEYYGDYHRNFS